MPASRHSTAIARLGEGRAAPEFEAITEFLVDTTRAGPRTGGGRCRADGRREKLGEIRVRPRFAPVYAGRSDGHSPSGAAGCDGNQRSKVCAQVWERKSALGAPTEPMTQSPRRIPRAIVSFDLDGTLVRGISSGQFVADRLGHGDILRALELQYDTGLMSAQAVAATEAPYFSGRSRENITSIMRDVPLIEGIRETLQELHRRSVFTVLNTLAWRFMASAVGDRFGFDEWTGARMNCGPGGLLTGAVARHFDERDKVRAVARLAHRFGVPMSRIAAVGDARSDIPLFRAVGFSIALNGSAQARAAASVAVATPWLPDILRALPPHFLPAED